MRCDAIHDGHDCTEFGSCRRAVTAMCDRVGTRDRAERERDVLDGTLDLSACVITPDQHRERTGGSAGTVMVRPVDLREGDRVLLAGEWRTVESSPFPVLWCGRIRTRVALDHDGSMSWPLDQASRFESVEILARPAVHDRRVA